MTAGERPEIKEDILSGLVPGSANYLVDQLNPGRLAGVLHMIDRFAWDHLPPNLAAVSEPFGRLAVTVANGPQNPDTTDALRKLWEAKNAAVVAHVDTAQSENRVCTCTPPAHARGISRCDHNERNQTGALDRPAPL